MAIGSAWRGTIRGEEVTRSGKNMETLGLGKKRREGRRKRERSNRRKRRRKESTKGKKIKGGETKDTQK